MRVTPCGGPEFIQFWGRFCSRGFVDRIEKGCSLPSPFLSEQPLPATLPFDRFLNAVALLVAGDHWNPESPCPHFHLRSMKTDRGSTHSDANTFNARAVPGLRHRTLPWSPPSPLICNALADPSRLARNRLADPPRPGLEIVEFQAHRCFVVRGSSQNALLGVFFLAKICFFAPNLEI